MASPNISFDTIPSSIKKPGAYLEFNTRLAVNSLPANVQKVLLVGQKLTDATAWATGQTFAVGDIRKPTTANGHIYFCITAGAGHAATEPTWPTTQGGEVTDNVAVWKEIGSDSPLAAQLTPAQIFSDAEAKTACGDGSMVHLMARAALRANRYVTLWYCSVADGAGVNASGTVVVTATPTASGSVRLWIGDDYVEISFTSSDTATTIALALKNAVAAKSYLPVVAKAATGTLTLIAKNKGTVAHQIKIAADITAGKGVSAALTQLANGTVDPDLHATGGVIDKITPTQYHLVASPYLDDSSVGYMKTYLDNVSGALEQRPGVCVMGMVDTVANVQTKADTCNHGRMLIAAVSQSKTPALVIGASIASIMAGVEDPAQPLNTAKVTGMVAPDVSNWLTRTEQETLLANGITPLEASEDQIVRIVRAVSTYQTDVSLLDITTIRTLDYVREAVRTRIKSRYPSSKLNARIAADVRSEVVAVLKQCEALEIVENVDANLDGVIAERDSSDANRLDVRIPVDVVNGLHVFAARIDLIL